jgi:hypothetical protein
MTYRDDFTLPPEMLARIASQGHIITETKTISNTGNIFTGLYAFTNPPSPRIPSFLATSLPKIA